MPKILIVDDNAGMRDAYKFDIERLTKFKAETAFDGKDAIEKLSENRFDCIVLDLEMPRADGFDVLRNMKSRDDKTPVIVYTGTGNYQNCIKAVQLGAFGFVDKSDPVESVVQDIKHALHIARLEKQTARLLKKEAENSKMIGKSKAIKNLKEDIQKLTTFTEPILVLGESGSGKELVVEELHRLSSPEMNKNNMHLEVVLCSAIPDTLVESILFGHEKGAFTGADIAKAGAFELANGGILFLDEMGELPLAVQAKLLRVIENGTIRRVGGDKDINIDVRVVAATHRDLAQKVKDNEFREDLYYRLNTFILNIPPLRERLSDVPMLINHFMKKVCENQGCKYKTVSEEALEILTTYKWENNNIRELKNAVSGMVWRCNNSEVITPEHLPAEITGSATFSNSGSYEDQVNSAKREIINIALDKNGRNLTKTANYLGLADHSSLTKIMKRLGLK
jgi:two-component system, NtrC family, nitrogen regulation response regulator NtrX